jgi:hypothetical protein
MGFIISNFCQAGGFWERSAEDFLGRLFSLFIEVKHFHHGDQEMKSKEKDTIVDIESIPEELTDYDQWVNWKREIRDEKETKIPINPNTGKYASTSDSRTWGSFEEATEGLENYDVNGIGFVLTADDPFVGGDLDHCLDSETGELSEQAREVVRLVDTYTEKSPSGEGLRFIAKGKLPGSKTRKGNIELYQKSRYLTITGWHLANTPTEIHERQDQIDAMYYKHIDTSPSLPICKRPDSPPCELDNDEIMENARRLAGSKLDALRQGITSGYPSASEADLAFCGMIAQVTHGDVEKIDQIFRQSQLMRPKWDAKRSANGKTYGEMTIQKAITSSNNPFHIAEANIESMLVKVKKAPGTALRLILETPDYLRGLAFLAKNDQAKYELALAKLKELGLKARELTSLKSAVASEKKRLKQHKDSDSQEQGGTPVSDFLTNPPVPKTFLIPTGYRLSQDGIMRMGLPSPGRGSIDRLIAAAPVLIQGRLKDTHDQSEQLKMVWRRDKKWQTLTVPRGIIMNSRLITSLADQGFPVNSETARFVVEYLDLLEAINLQQIPVATISSRLGWQGEMGKKGGFSAAGGTFWRMGKR